MNNKIHIILNPVAGEGLATKRWAKFEKELSLSAVQYELHQTEKKGHAIEIAKDLSGNGAVKIGVFGGDGTLNEVVNGIMTHEINDLSLVLFPAGSSCDFEKKLEFSKDWISRLMSLNSVPVDVCRVDCKDEEGKDVFRYFINNSSIGIISLANERFNSVSGFTQRFKRITVDGAAVLAGLSAIKEFSGFKGTITLENDTKEEGVYSNLTFFKNPYFGGGMNYGVETDPSDGFISLAQVGFKSRLNLATLIPSLYLGNVFNRNGTSYKTCTFAKLETEKPMLVEVDGEVAGYTPAVYSILNQRVGLTV